MGVVSSKLKQPTQLRNAYGKKRPVFARRSRGTDHS
jgi:hypothetical protein